ncbi:TBC1 domain family member 14 [Liparis tanakae]|uniref:TBC1 domain family member 14 n=1 Tax=Liparis tanakae TaxID=230148 RepID=A0A4Z2GLM7_9TELE|nr:TBC1 domain family member 14 [Liparis tanakae]
MQGSLPQPLGQHRASSLVEELQSDAVQMLTYFAAFEVFFEENLPKLFAHFQKNNLTPDIYLIDWIFTLYSKSLPLDLACRVWDVFCRDSEEFLFRTGLALLRLYQEVLTTMDFIHMAQRDVSIFTRAAMRTARLLLLCVLGSALLSSATCNNGSGPDECCFRTYPWKLSRKAVRSYYLTDYRCATPAAILVTKKGRHFCVDPKLSWVRNIMRRVDEGAF